MYVGFRSFLGALVVDWPEPRGLVRARRRIRGEARCRLSPQTLTGGAAGGGAAGSRCKRRWRRVRRGRWPGGHRHGRERDSDLARREGRGRHDGDARADIADGDSQDRYRHGAGPQGRCAGARDTRGRKQRGDRAASSRRAPRCPERAAVGLEAGARVQPVAVARERARRLRRRPSVVRASARPSPRAVRIRSPGLPPARSACSAAGSRSPPSGTSCGRGSTARRPRGGPRRRTRSAPHSRGCSVARVTCRFTTSPAAY